MDGWWAVVANAGRLCGFLDPVLVVAGSFERAGAGGFASFGDQQGGDLGKVDR